MNKKKATLQEQLFVVEMTAKIVNNILEEVFTEHPEIVNRAIVRFVKERTNNASIQEEDNATNGIHRT